MRRALDAAILEIGSLSERDRILDFFFEHAKTLFEFSVFFIVKGDSALGRNVNGLGAPPGLVARLNLPLNGSGVLARARDSRRPFVISGDPTEADIRLFGNLGRAMPAAQVAPIVVRDRVVGIFLGDGPAEPLLRRAHQAERDPMELAQEEMLLWAATTGQVLERLILRRKGDSTAPPRLSSFPPRPLSIPPPGALPSLARPDRLPSDLAPQALATPAHPAPASRPTKRGVAFALLVLAVLAGGVGWFLFQQRREAPAFDRVVVAGPTLAGWPSQVDPAKVVDPARAASGLAGRPELGRIEAEVISGGHVDFKSPLQNREGIYLKIVFVTDNTEADVRVDPDGIRAPRLQGRSQCADRPCHPAIPAPQCSFAQIFQAALAAGVAPNDRPLITYASEGGALGWVVSVPDRGRIRLDPATCAPFPRERLRPPALPLAKIPGAPRDVDPIGIEPLARAQSGLEQDALLLEIEARGVGSEGRVDLNAPDAAIIYVFADPVASTVRRWRQVKVGPDGMPVTSGDGDREPLPIRFFRSATPPPVCTFKEARAYLALAQPNVGTVRLTYGPDPATQLGQWTLESSGARQTFSDSECEVSTKTKQKIPSAK